MARGSDVSVLSAATARPHRSQRDLAVLTRPRPARRVRGRCRPRSAVNGPRLPRAPPARATYLEVAAVRAARLLLVFTSRGGGGRDGGRRRAPSAKPQVLGGGGGRRQGSRGCAPGGSGAERHVVRVLAPAPRVHHEVAEARAGGDERRRRLWLPSAAACGLDRGRPDDRHQHPLRGILAEDDGRRLRGVVRHLRLHTPDHCLARIRSSGGRGPHSPSPGLVLAPLAGAAPSCWLSVLPALSPAGSWQADVSWNSPALRPVKEQNGSAGPDGQGWPPNPWVKPALRCLYSPTQAAAAGSSGRLAFAMTGKLDARRRAPENNNLPPGSLLLFFPRYISRLGGTNHRKAPARWPQRRVTGRASQWPGLDFFLARPGRSRTCARVLSAMLLAAALVFFFSSRGANSVRNSRGARDVGTHPDTPSGSPAPAVPLRG